MVYDDPGFKTGSVIDLSINELFVIFNIDLKVKNEASN